MAKFKVRFKLKELELEIDGSREDIPAIGQNIGHQLSNLIEPAVNIVDGDNTFRRSPSEPLIIDNDNRKKIRKRKSSSGSTGTAGAADEVLNWKHDSSKFNMPSQNWNTAKKAIWLLYVIKENLQRTSLSAKMIADTFNKHFKQAGEIKSFNVTRDLGNAKVKTKPSPVGEDASKEPHEWYLTDAGIKSAQESVAEA